MRSPYGRDGIHALAARLFAERGYQVVVQSCRGTFGSGGTFNAYRDEAGDGLATLDWLEAQTWSRGKVAMFGPSYLGIAQWAVATDPHPSLRALAPAISSARVRSLHVHRRVVLARQHLEVGRHARRPAAQRPANGCATSSAAPNGWPAASRLRRSAKPTASSPASRCAFYQDWLSRKHDDAFWAPVEFERHLDAVAVPVTMVTGWYDMFLPAQLSDFRALRDAGRDVRITIGPWKHADPGVAGESVRDALDWFGVHLGRGSSERRTAVRVFLGGSARWLDLHDWPPPSRLVRWHLQPKGGLHVRTGESGAPDRYRYDPADPTPSVGGSLLARGGPRDNRALERRSDVLVYTSAVLVRDVEAIGPVTAELFVRSSLEHTDFFVRVCDVDPSGQSRNICDGMVRLTPEHWRPASDGVSAVDVDLWPMAHVFRRGHRIRVQVSSGAHPRFARNLGGGEPFGTATTMRIADQEIWHDAGHPSAIVLPVRDPG